MAFSALFKASFFPLKTGEERSSKDRLCRISGFYPEESCSLALTLERTDSQESLENCHLHKFVPVHTSFILPLAKPLSSLTHIFNYRTKCPFHTVQNLRLIFQC